jgi:hypothetical protein
MKTIQPCGQQDLLCSEAAERFPFAGLPVPLNSEGQRSVFNRVQRQRGNNISLRSLRLCGEYTIFMEQQNRNLTAKLQVF